MTLTAGIGDDWVCTVLAVIHQYCTLRDFLFPKVFCATSKGFTSTEVHVCDVAVLYSQPKCLEECLVCAADTSAFGGPRSCCRPPTPGAEKMAAPGPAPDGHTSVLRTMVTCGSGEREVVKKLITELIDEDGVVMQEPAAPPFLVYLLLCLLFTKPHSLENQDVLLGEDIVRAGDRLLPFGHASYVAFGSNVAWRDQLWSNLAGALKGTWANLTLTQQTIVFFEHRSTGACQVHHEIRGRE